MAFDPFVDYGSYEEPPPFCIISEEEISTCDIARFNLIVAEGLPGAENLDIAACVRKLDHWANLVRINTEHWWPRFIRSPEEFNHSPGQFRMMALVTVLQRDLGVLYNLSFMEGDYNGTDSRNLFIHGLLSGHGGTCATMPVLYIAIGRRLGYPLKLVRAKEHSFARWDEPNGERFNIEATSLGFSPRNDEYYRTWPKPINALEIQEGYFLRSLSPREELAVFLGERGNCLLDNMRFLEAMRAYKSAAELAPNDPCIENAWATSSILYMAIDNAEKKARLEKNAVIELKHLPMPDVPNGWNELIPFARETLERIAKIHVNRTSEMRANKSSKQRVNQTIIAGK
jgi:hypothetical protein